MTRMPAIFFGHGNPLVSMKNHMATAIARMQMLIEIIASALTMSGGSGGWVLLKNPHLFPIRNAGRLSKTTSALIYFHECHHRNEQIVITDIYYR